MRKRYFRKYITFKFFKIRKYVKEKEKIKILDIGAGNHSASKTKELFVNCEYWGVGRCTDYANDEEFSLYLLGFIRICRVLYLPESQLKDELYL